MQPWRKAALEQINLRYAFQGKVELYFHYRKLKKLGKKLKAPCDLKELQRDQTVINKLRRLAALLLINYIASMHYALSVGAKEIEF